MRLTKFAMLILALLGLIAVGCDREITGDVGDLPDNSDEACFECHNGYLDQAQAEWNNSVHASGANIDYTNRGGSDCTQCHFQEGFVSWIETGVLPDEAFSTVSPIGCFTCHDPHEKGDLTLRSVSAVTLANDDVFDHGDGNLCVACHHSRMSADGITDDQGTHKYWGPHHGPQGDLVNGSNGWEFPGEGYSFPSSPHAAVVTDACAGCHMGEVRTHEGSDIGGHSWNMRGLEDTALILDGVCSDGACHPDVNEFDFIDSDSTDYDGDLTVEGRQTEMDGIADSLRILLEAGGWLSDDHATTGTIADQHIAGSVYNYLIYIEDRSRGIHNWNYIKALLDASVDYVTTNGAPAYILDTYSSH